jgi:hypothetical protein
MFRSTKLTLISLLTLCLFAVAASGQTTRVYVAVNSGNDANACGNSSPCKTVTKAMTVVDTGGEVVLTESGDYDKFFVNKSVTVAGADGVNAAIVSNGGSAVAMLGLTATDVVTFRNLKFVGTNAQASDGIINSFAGTLNVDGCVFTGFNNALTMSNVAGYLFVHNSTFRGNLFGIGVMGPQGEGIERATIDSCTVESNETGITLNGKVTANIRNSILANNASRALMVRSTVARYLADAVVDNCQINSNTVGVMATTTNSGYSTVKLSRSVVTGNLLGGVVIGPNSVVYTLGNNVVNGNFPDLVGGVLTALAPK